MFSSGNIIPENMIIGKHKEEPGEACLLLVLAVGRNQGPQGYGGADEGKGRDEQGKQ